MTKDSDKAIDEILQQLENTCDYCEGKGYTETGGMAMEDDLVEKIPCNEEIHEKIPKAKAAIKQLLAQLASEAKS